MKYSNRNISSRELSVENVPKIMLSVHRSDDCRLLHDFLKEYFSMDVCTDNKLIFHQTFDFYILDQLSFHRYKNKILQIKDQSAPVFLPLLLLMPQDTTDKAYHSILESVDDVITIPSAKKIMQSRIQVLMKQREYSLRLQGKNKQLVEEKERFRLIAENSMDMISCHAPDGTYLYASPACEEITGYSPAELIGHNAFDNIHPDDRNRIQHEIDDLVEEKDLVSITFRKKMKNGAYKWVESNMRPIYHKDTGRFEEIQAGTRDISARKEFEEQLKDSLKEKETLLQEIHHRVKNNLAVVSGMLQLQAYSTDNEEVQSLLSDSDSRIKTMALIHEKLYQSRSLSQLDFGSYMKDLIEGIKKVSTNEDDIRLQFTCDSFKLNVNQAVPCALILNEVITNSYKHAFSEEEEGTINVTLSQRNEWIFVKVSDNGQGLTEDIKELKKSMGFTIIETLIDQLDADYSISSEDGLSTSFTFKTQNVKGASSSIV